MRIDTWNYLQSLKKYCIEEFGEEYFVNGLKKIFNKDNLNKNTSFASFKSPDFKKAILINSEEEIPEVIGNHEEISLIISKDIESSRIRNIYQKFATPDVRIYSQNFFDNIDEAFRFIELCKEIHKSDVSFN